MTRVPAILSLTVGQAVDDAPSWQGAQPARTGYRARLGDAEVNVMNSVGAVKVCCRWVLGSLLLGMGCIHPPAQGASTAEDSSSIPAAQDGGTTDAAFSDAAVQDAGDPAFPCPSSTAYFQPNQPGISVLFMLSQVELVGQKIGVGTGGFFVAAREEFEPPVEDIPLDTCVLGEAPKVKTCSNRSTCAPEQDCVPQKDSNGAAMPGTEHCETPQAALNMGPMTVDGFADGPMAFASNANKDGYYTATPDGRLDTQLITFDRDYLLSGVGDVAQGLGAFHGTLHVPPHTQLVTPAPQPNLFGAPQISVTPGAELPLTWSGGGVPGAIMELTLQGAANNTAGMVRCRLRDVGHWTLTADQVVAANLGNLAMLNTLLLKRKNWGQVCGLGISHASIMSESTVAIYVGLGH